MLGLQIDPNVIRMISLPTCMWELLISKLCVCVAYILGVILLRQHRGGVWSVGCLDGYPRAATSRGGRVRETGIPQREDGSHGGQ